MSFPTNQVPTTNLDEASDSPSAARADLLSAVQNLNTIVSGASAANGVALLDSNGRIPSTKLPQSITYTGAGNQIINPSSRIVNIQDIVRLTSQNKSDILNISTSTLTRGDVALSSDGNSGTVALCIYDGTQWLRLHAQTPLNSTVPPITTGSVGTGTGGGATVTIGTITKGDPGTNVVVTNSGNTQNVILDFTIPQGSTGTVGADGLAGTIVVGNVSTGDPGTTATVVNIGTVYDAILNFSIPQGPQGSIGPAGTNGTNGTNGSAGEAATISVGTVTTGTTATITNVGSTSSAVLNFQVPWIPGPAGAGATISVGTVSTGTVTSVTNVGSPTAATFNFVIQQGAQGAQGNGFTFQNTWSNIVTYSTADIVSYQGETWKSQTVSNLGNTPVEGTYWTLWAAKGSNGTNGTNGSSSTVSIGTVTTGTTAAVTNTGTSANAWLNFQVPWIPGPKGDTGTSLSQLSQDLNTNGYNIQDTVWGHRIIFTATDSLRLGAFNGSGVSSFRFYGDGSVLFPNGNTFQFNGTTGATTPNIKSTGTNLSLIVQDPTNATNKGNVIVTNNTVGVKVTSVSNGTKEWNFQSDGTIIFPNSEIQPIAYLGTATSSIIGGVRPDNTTITINNKTIIIFIF